MRIMGIWDAFHSQTPKGDPIQALG
jgi:hypothetical protein